MSSDDDEDAPQWRTTDTSHLVSIPSGGVLNSEESTDRTISVVPNSIVLRGGEVVNQEMMDRDRGTCKPEVIKRVDAAGIDNRKFLQVILGGKAYTALQDGGAMVSLIRVDIARRYESRIVPSNN